MIKNKETSDPNSCLNKAYDDEPLFVLRAKDPIARLIIHNWCELRCKLGLNKASDTKISDALNCVRLIDDWRSKNTTWAKHI